MIEITGFPIRQSLILDRKKNKMETQKIWRNPK